MSYKMTKRGSLDNEITNEFFCDGPEDLAKIPASYINLGSVAVVVDPFEMYIANSNKEWISLMSSSTQEVEIIEEESEP